MARPKKIDIREGYRICACCGVIKEHSEFHKNKVSPNGVRSVCAKCRAYKMSQRYLELAVIKGDKSIVECEKCEAYFKRSSYKTCIHCRKKD